MPDYSDLKRKQRATWALGEYDRIARGIQAVADHLVRFAQVRPGERVLDVACGTGNTALAARARGASVVGLDLTPELLAVAHDRSTEEGWDDIAWREGDAEDLPFPDGAFDVVLSSCGLMFAPDQERVAREVARVVRPGGRVAIQAWSPGSGVTRLFALSGSYVPPPVGVPSPFAWGDEDKVRALFGPSFTDFSFERYDCPEFGDAPEQVADLYLTRFGPTFRAHQLLPPGQAAAYRADMIALFQGYVTPADGKVRWGREYLLTRAVRARPGP